MSVAEFVEQLFDILRKAGVNVSINLKPQEVPNAIPFDQDAQPRPYDPITVNAWWRILLSTQRVMQVFRGRFKGKTQPIGLMWGTLDIRDVRYNGKPASPGEKADYIRRNAMNEELIEVGWWSGSAAYPKPAFYSFTYPQPKGIEHTEVSPRRSAPLPTAWSYQIEHTQGVVKAIDQDVITDRRVLDQQLQDAITQSKILRSASSCKLASWCESQEMLLVFPLPAECWIR